MPASNICHTRFVRQNLPHDGFVGVIGPSGTCVAIERRARCAAAGIALRTRWPPSMEMSGLTRRYRRRRPERSRDCSMFPTVPCQQLPFCRERYVMAGGGIHLQGREGKKPWMKNNVCRFSLEAKSIFVCATRDSVVYGPWIHWICTPYVRSPYHRVSGTAYLLASVAGSSR